MKVIHQVHREPNSNKIFDTHSHIFLCKEKNEDEILAQLKKKGNILICENGVDLESNKHLIEISKNFDFYYCAVGIQPENVENYENIDETILELEKMAKNEKVVGIGEVGLDYYWTKLNLSKDNFEKNKQIQIEFFTKQILLAKKLSLPLIIHNREASDDIYKILVENDFKNFIMHCFSENLDFANKLIDFSPNCKISFSGILTFKNAKDIQEVASSIPLKNIIIETDSPYLTPIPLRGQENYPWNVELTLEKLCELRKEKPEIVKSQVWRNSLEVFGVLV